MDDSLMIKYMKKKKEVGMEMLIDNYGALVTAIVRRNLNNLNQFEEECIDDILLSIWNNIGSFNPKKNTFKNWIGAISKYKTIDYKRKYIKLMETQDISDCIIEEPSKIEEGILQREVKAEVENLLYNLNEKDRMLFIKYYLEDVDMDSLSREMNMSRDVIYNRLSRGRTKLRKIAGKSDIV